jgi:hypothetical protein
MPLLWDIVMSCVTGVLFSSFKPLFKNVFGDDLNEKKIFIIGLLFNQLIIWLISIWCWFNVDPNWLMLYWVDPEAIRPLIHIIYIIFPIFYVGSYILNLKLQNAHKSRYSLIISVNIWLLFTILVFPNFITMFAGNETATHGVDYPAQLIWNLATYPDNNVLWILPITFRTYFIFFFLQIVFFILFIELIGISIAKKNLLNKEPEKPSKLLIFLSGTFLDLSNKLMIRKSKKDSLYKSFVSSFKAKIQMSTKDGCINRFLVFDGKGGMNYSKGIIENPDATVMFTSVKKLFQYLKSLGDFKLGVKYNRFKIIGNINVLLKLQFLTNYINPKTKKMKVIKQASVD